MKQLRERLQDYGAQTLLIEELLAIILAAGSGNEQALALAGKLLAKYGGLGGMMQADWQELRQEKGLGEVKVAQLKAVLELGRRLNRPQHDERYQISAPEDAARLVMQDMAYLGYEQFRVLVLDARNRVVDNVVLYRGTVNSSALRTAEVFRPAIVRNCPNIIACHSHPSGSPEPSPEDIEVTKQLVAAGNVLDINLVDHLVIGQQRFVSLKERLRW